MTSVTTNTGDAKRTPRGMLRGWVGRGIGGTAFVVSLAALGPCHAGADGTAAAGTLLVILGLGQVGAEAQSLKGTAAAAESKVVAGRPYKVVADLSKARAAQILPLTGMVWANVKSGVFHREGEHWYGKTGQGRFMTEAEARKAGYRPAEEAAAGQKSATRAPG
jgi:hypothetical protein